MKPIGAAVLLCCIACRGGDTEARAIPGDRAGTITVEVLNANGRAGDARVGTRLLRREGIDVVYFGNADGAPLDSTTIIVRRGSAAVGETVRKALGRGHSPVAPGADRAVRAWRHRPRPERGNLDDITAAVKAFNADTVAVTACPEMDGIRLRSLAWELEKTGTDLCVSPALLDVAGPRTTVRPTAGLTLLHVDHPQLSGFRLVLKGLFDRCAAGAALVMLAPLMTILASAVWLHDRGPALFTQVRVGKDGHAFRIYKFRTMVVDAEQRRMELLDSNDSDGVLFKLRRDPRVTPVGARLRRWSIDELPQLFNVFLGHMSLVGPRPALPDEADKYAEHVRRRLVVKPGLTGLWQVSGRSDLSWEESVRLDLRYVENWSFALDLQIMWKTISVLVRGSGAY